MTKEQGASSSADLQGPVNDYRPQQKERIVRVDDGEKTGGYYAFRKPPFDAGPTEVMHFDKDGNPIADIVDNKPRIRIDRSKHSDISYELRFDKKGKDGNTEHLIARTVEPTGIGHTYALTGHPELAEDKVTIHPSKNESQHIPESWNAIEKQNHSAIQGMSGHMTADASVKAFPAGGPPGAAVQKGGIDRG